MSQQNTNQKAVSKHQLILIAAVAALLLSVVSITIAIILSNRDEQGKSVTDPSDTSFETSDQSTVPSEQSKPMTEPSEESTEPSEVPTEEPTQPVVYVPPTNPAPTQPPKTVLYLPYTIPGTTLTIQRVANYSGVFLEDASNDQVTDVAMMLLQNTGSEALEYALITLTYDDKTLTFEVSALPAGAYAAVQEISRKSAAVGDLTKAVCEAAPMDGMGMSAEQIKVEDNGDNSFTVTNVSDQSIGTVRIFYKYYLSEENAYIGGITFTARITNLDPGESVKIAPNHYSSEGSTIVMVRTYDADA